KMPVATRLCRSLSVPLRHRCRETSPRSPTVRADVRVDESVVLVDGPNIPRLDALAHGAGGEPLAVPRHHDLVIISGRAHRLEHAVEEHRSRGARVEKRVVLTLVGELVLMDGAERHPGL